MTATLEATVVRAEARRLGIELRAEGGRLRYRPREAMTADLAEKLRACKGDLLDVIGTVGVSQGDCPRRRAADMIRKARRTGDDDLAIALRDAWRERVAICKTDAGLTREQAEKVAEENIRVLLVSQDSIRYNRIDERDARHNTEGNQDEQQDAISHLERDGHRSGAALETDARSTGLEHRGPGSVGRVPGSGDYDPSEEAAEG